MVAVAVTDFAQGIRVALGLAFLLLAAIFVTGLVWFPRGADAAMADAWREARRVNEP